MAVLCETMEILTQKEDSSTALRFTYLFPSPLHEESQDQLYRGHLTKSFMSTHLASQGEIRMTREYHTKLNTVVPSHIMIS